MDAHLCHSLRLQLADLQAQGDPAEQHPMVAIVHEGRGQLSEGLDHVWHLPHHPATTPSSRKILAGRKAVQTLPCLGPGQPPHQILSDQQAVSRDMGPRHQPLHAFSDNSRKFCSTTHLQIRGGILAGVVGGALPEAPPFLCPCHPLSTRLHPHSYS